MRIYLLFVLLNQVVYSTAQNNETIFDESFCVPDRLDGIRIREVVHKPTIQPSQWTRSFTLMHPSEWTQTPNSSHLRTKTPKLSRTAISRLTLSPHKSQPSMYSNTQTSIRGPSSLSLVSPARSTTHTIVVLTKTETVTNCNTLITQRSTSSTARKTTVPTSSSDAGRLTMPVWLVMISMAILLFLL